MHNTHLLFYIQGTLFSMSHIFCRTVWTILCDTCHHNSQECVHVILDRCVPHLLATFNSSFW